MCKEAFVLPGMCLRLEDMVSVAKRDVVICQWDQNIGCCWNTDTISVGHNGARVPHDAFFIGFEVTLVV